jgi:hypothetical protein
MKVFRKDPINTKDPMWIISSREREREIRILDLKVWIMKLGPTHFELWMQLSSKD